MNTQEKKNYSITRGLGALFIFASLLFLEHGQYLFLLLAVVIGVLNMSAFPWSKKWSSIVLYVIDALFSVIVFYLFIQMGNTYIQWLWLALLVYYILMLRGLFKKNIQPSDAKPKFGEEVH